MNYKQTALLRWLDSLWEKHERAAGRPYDRDARLAFYSKVTGRTVTSSKQLNNDQVTVIKRRVLALAQPANFNAQLKSQEDNDPAAIRQRLNDRIDVALYIYKPDSDYAEPGAAEVGRSEYAHGTARNMFGKPWHELTNDELRKLAGVFEDRAKRRQKRDAAAALDYINSRGEASDRVPF